MSDDLQAAPPASMQPPARRVRGRWLVLLRDGLALAALTLAVLNVASVQRNRSAQAVLAQGEEAAVRAQTVVNLNSSLVQLMAKTAVEQQDVALRELLARNGVTFQLSTPSQIPAPPQATAP